LSRNLARVGFKDEREQRKLIELGIPVAMLLAIPVGYANYANLNGDQPAAVVYVLIAATIMTGFFASMFLASWSLGWNCVSLGFASVILALCTPFYTVAAYFQAHGQSDTAQGYWVPATAASLGAIGVRAAVQVKKAVSSHLDKRAKAKGKAKRKAKRTPPRH